MNREPKISVCMAMYNAALYLRECIESILSQSFTDFELLIVDDGSTDDSKEIVNSYDDERIRLICNDHDYIAALNLLLREAKGKYIARMDADDIMLPYRLSAQYGYMEKHPEIGVLGGGMQQFGRLHGKLIPLSRITMQDMINSCCIAHPTVMLRTSLIRSFGFHYEEEFKYAEDYRLWMQMFKENVLFRNIPSVLINYRVSETQISSVHSQTQMEKTNEIKKDGAKWLLQKQSAISFEKFNMPFSQNLLTVVIPFLNEGKEVVNTVRSIRNTAGKEVDIIVVNDCSDDDFDYKANLKNFNVAYVHNTYRIGAAASKQKGAFLCQTPYFLLLDAHMRCYTSKWHHLIVEELQKNDRRILCCQTRSLTKDRGRIVGEDSISLTDGAYVTFDYKDYIPGIHWNECKREHGMPENQIACILGACYAASKRYWNSIRGLEGLMHYGSEETYLSLKAWMEGGGCYLLPHIIFGHIYRPAPPYRIDTAQMHYNTFVISHTLFPTSLRCWANSVAYKKSSEIYRGIQFWLSMNRSTLIELKAFYKKVCSSDFEHVLKINDIPDVSKSEMAKMEEKRMQSIIDFLATSDKSSSPYLWDGDMGLLLALCEYERFDKRGKYALLASEVLERISSCLSRNPEFPISFAHGICGIGWGLIYLIRNELTTIHFEDELSFVDRKVLEVNMERISDFSFETGVGGILCYIVNRLYLNQMFGLSNPFDVEYLAEAMQASQKAMIETSDFRTHSYALQLQEYGKDDWHILRPRWKDIVDLPMFLPHDSSIWKKDMSSATGYLYNLLQVLSSS